MKVVFLTLCLIALAYAELTAYDGTSYLKQSVKWNCTGGKPKFTCSVSTGRHAFGDGYTWTASASEKSEATNCVGEDIISYGNEVSEPGSTCPGGYYVSSGSYTNYSIAGELDFDLQSVAAVAGDFKKRSTSVLRQDEPNSGAGINCDSASGSTLMAAMISVFGDQSVPNFLCVDPKDSRDCEYTQIGGVWTPNTSNCPAGQVDYEIVARWAPGHPAQGSLPLTGNIIASLYPSGSTPSPNHMYFAAGQGGSSYSFWEWNNGSGLPFGAYTTKPFTSMGAGGFIPGQKMDDPSGLNKDYWRFFVGAWKNTTPPMTKAPGSKTFK